MYCICVTIMIQCEYNVTEGGINMSDLMSYLFETNAIRFCEENKPFWYTSGKIGPYFINTHFVYGNEKEAVELLSFIDECLADKLTLPEKVFEKVLKQQT